MRKQCKMQYGKDEKGQEVLLKDGKFQVMMAWEKPYMEACIDALKPTGDVLEVGFGLGFSATRIQTYHPKSHTIIEYHPEVLKKAKEWAKDYPNVHIVEGTWQEKLSTLGVFDVIFFDDYPLESEEEISQMKKDSSQSKKVLEKGKKVIADVQEQLPFLETIRYSNEDLDMFFKALSLKSKTEVKQVAKFLWELLSRSQIDRQQLESRAQTLFATGNISKEEFHSLGATIGKLSALRNEMPTGDRFYDFLGACLRSHMKEGSRFSCFLGCSKSRLEDNKFFNEIVLNPNLEFHEEPLAIDVPEHCHYFEGSTPLVTTITKRI